MLFGRITFCAQHIASAQLSQLSAITSDSFQHPPPAPPPPRAFLQLSQILSRHHGLWRFSRSVPGARRPWPGACPGTGLWVLLATPHMVAQRQKTSKGAGACLLRPAQPVSTVRRRSSCGTLPSTTGLRSWLRCLRCPTSTSSSTPLTRRARVGGLAGWRVVPNPRVYTQSGGSPRPGPIPSLLRGLLALGVGYICPDPQQ